MYYIIDFILYICKTKDALFLILVKILLYDEVH